MTTRKATLIVLAWNRWNLTKSVWIPFDERICPARR